MKSHITQFLVLSLLYAPMASAQDTEPRPHEYASITKVDLEEAVDYVARKTSGQNLKLARIRDFTRSDTEGDLVTLYDFLKDPSGKPKPVVLLTYIRADCENTLYELPSVKAAYDRYRDRGFDVLGVAEYSNPLDLEEFVWTNDPNFRIAVGTRTNDDDDIRFITEHYRYRKSLGDDRKWGTPFSFLIVDGDVRNVYYCPGEFPEGGLEDFLRKHLK